jgi:RNA polymerase sigma-70 factor (ECF subfamily)
MTGPADDAALVRAIAAGERSALGDLYDRYAGTVLALCLRVLGDRAEAEEAMSDVFWQVWQQAGRFDSDRGNPAAWLITLARTRAIDRRRAQVRRRAVLAVDGVGAPRTERLPSDADPFADAVQSQQADRVRRALDALDPGQRRVVEMNFYEGLSHSEIAEALHEPLGTIKTRIRTGLMRLKETLGASLPGEATA